MSDNQTLALPFQLNSFIETVDCLIAGAFVALFVAILVILHNVRGWNANPWFHPVAHHMHLAFSAQVESPSMLLFYFDQHP